MALEIEWDEAFGLTGSLCHGCGAVLEMRQRFAYLLNTTYEYQPWCEPCVNGLAATHTLSEVN